MAKFFKYKTLDALLNDAQARGPAITATEDLSPLLQTARVGPRTVGNRLAIHPMEGCDGSLDGAPDDLTFRRYQRFGAGGAKLIWGEAAAVVPEGRANTRQLLMAERHASALARLVETCKNAHRQAWGHDSDLLVGIQLTHSGRYSVPRPILAQHDPLLDPRTIIDKAAKRAAGPDDPLISDDELDRLQDRYVEAAALAFQVGFDFVDIKQCHRYLLCELLSSRTRPGRYGGSFENRTRFARELLERLREAHPQELIGSRLNLFDGPPFQSDGSEARTGIPAPYTTPVLSTWGTREDDPLTPDLTEPLRHVGNLAAGGLALLNVTLGNPYGNPHFGRPFEFAPVDGYESPEHAMIGVARHLHLTAEVQQAFPDLPVVGTGYSWLQSWALNVGAAQVRDGRVHFVGMGRAALANPDFARSVYEGKPLDPKKTCRTFSYCTALMRAKHNELGQFPTGCPPFDKAVYDPIWDAAQKKPEATS